MSDEGAGLLAAREVGYRDPQGRERLAGVDLEVSAHGCALLMGSSGSGKSLLLRVLYGLEPASAGTLRLLGLDLRGAGTRQRLSVWGRAGFVFVEGALVSNLTLRDNVELPLRYRGELSGDEIRRRANGLLEQLGILGSADQRPAGLGLAVKKRAGLARALVLQPRILFADELLSIPDDQARGRVLEALGEARWRWGTALVLAEASAGQAGPLEPRVYRLDGGRLEPLEVKPGGRAPAK